MKRERLDWLADNPLNTKRFAWHIGRRSRHMTVRDVADGFHLDWHAVKERDKQYMRAQLARAGTPAPQVIGIDEISVRKGRDYRIVVSDLPRMRPIWFGGQDRKESSMAQFYEWLGPRKSARIRLAVMDWCSSLRCLRLNPYQEFAQMIERHWHGIAAYCRPENKVSWLR